MPLVQIDLIQGKSVTHNTAPTQFVEGNGLRYAYRTLGSSTGTPLVFCQRFRGTMDDWDPAVIDAIAAERPVILFDNGPFSSAAFQPLFWVDHGFGSPFYF
jgi:pimeloyl-ACP methyl ester carboxylesterase